MRVSSASLVRLRRAADTLPLDAPSARASLIGNYRSAFKGRGMEFEDTRPYQPGDDMRTLDWRVMARTGKPYTKLFREERERPVLLWLDLRKPMFFATQGVFKSVLAARAAALLAWSVARHGDRLGGLVFSERDHREQRPQRGASAVLRFIRLVTSHPSWEQAAAAQIEDRGAIERALLRLRRVTHPGSLIFLLSDFRELDEQAERHLVSLSRHNDVVVIFVYDPLEAELPPPGLYQVAAADREVALNTSSAAVREAYSRRFDERRERLLTLCRRHGLFFLPCETSADITQTLRDGLGLRQQLRGRR